ncbi:sodium:proton antiporter [Megasphaera sp. SW808]|uniref:Na+/H+ antiporter NhaC family protein n=1 Tax=Megasphaera sp. SW808 TaxID=2530045 RepID=UPI0014393A16|nr:Na+/H+ antiporter NhaC family protein [Megasphaera sp. SW808]NJE34288.1 sodium:proton antiporter [Megasphaera sp. SW808]
MELWILAAFSAALIACLAAGKSLIFALLAGFILFFSHGLKTGHSFSEMVHLALSGIKTTKNVLITLSLVGMLTAAWRISGTIPYIVYHASQWCDGSAVLLASFLLCALVSALTGTSFGTAATIGVICMTIANSMNIPPMYSGGAIMAGSYFGDRCSPMSTSALLVAAITKTDIFTNCRLMVKTAVVPSILTCVIYASMGILFQGSSTSSNAAELFCRSFNLSWITLVPAALVIILSARRIDVKAIMITSTIAAAIIASEIQHMPLSEIFASCLLGFHPSDPDLARLASGGGIVSMADVVAIICISSSYAGMFSGTGFLEAIQTHMTVLSQRITPFGTIIATSIITSMISCNQTLATMLTHQLCQSVEPDPQRLAIHLENTVIIISALIPWSIACSAFLAIIDAPLASVPLACYLYFIPLWNFLTCRPKQ